MDWTLYPRSYSLTKTRKLWGKLQPTGPENDATFSMTTVSVQYVPFWWAGVRAVKWPPPLHLGWGY